MFYLQDSSGLAATVAPKHGSSSSRATFLFFKVLFNCNIAMFKKHSSFRLVFKRINTQSNCWRTPPKPSKTMDSLDREDQKKSLIELNNRSSENLNIDFSEQNLKRTGCFSPVNNISISEYEIRLNFMFIKKSIKDWL